MGVSVLAQSSCFLVPPTFHPKKPTTKHRLTRVITLGLQNLRFNILVPNFFWKFGLVSAFTQEITRLPKNDVHLTTLVGEPHVASSDVSKSFVMYLRKQHRLQLGKVMTIADSARTGFVCHLIMNSLVSGKG